MIATEAWNLIMYCNLHDYSLWKTFIVCSIQFTEFAQYIVIVTPINDDKKTSSRYSNFLIIVLYNFIILNIRPFYYIDRTISFLKLFTKFRISYKKVFHCLYVYMFIKINNKYITVLLSRFCTINVCCLNVVV